MKEITNKISENPILTHGPNDTKNLPIAAKVLAILCIIQCCVSIPNLYIYIGLFLLEIKDGITDYQTTTTLIVYIIFLLSLLLVIIGLMLLGVYLLSNLRRLGAVTANVVAVLLIMTTITNIMLDGINIYTFILIISFVILWILKSYLDPSLSEERKLQKKLKDLDTKERAEKGTLGISMSKNSYAELNYFNIFWVFFICSILGYFGETLWHMIVDDPGIYQERAGLLFGPFSPIYGLGGVVMTVCLNKLVDKNIIIVFICSAILGGFFEYFCSLFLQIAFGITSWDYSNHPLNINGRTSVIFFILWGVFGTLWAKLAFKPLIKIINKIPWKLRYTLTVLLTILLIIDVVMTLQALDCWCSRCAGKPIETPIEQFYDKYFNDKFMQARFENMVINPEASIRGSHS